MRLAALTLALLALAACERGEKPESAGPAAPAIEVREVAAADAYGPAGDAVNAVALWSHPSINFQGLVIAATASGLKSYDLESGEPVSATSDTGATGAVGVFYGQGAPAQGYALATHGAGYVVRAIDNETRAFSAVDVEMGAPASGAFCVGRQDDAPALYEIGATGLNFRQIDILADRIAIGDPQPVSAQQGRFCHVDDRDGAIFTVGEDGAIRRIDPKTGESFGLAMIEGTSIDSSAILLSTNEGTERRQGGAIAILDGKSGVIRVIDLVDGHALGAVRIKSTFDLAAVSSATAIAAGYGNYGGVYRDGALAVVASASDQAPIRLVPWNGVLGALQLPLGVTVDPRAPSPEVEEESVIDIEFIEP